MRVNKKTMASIVGVSTNTMGKWMEQGCPHEKLDSREVEFETVHVLEWLYDETPSLNAKKSRSSEMPDVDQLDPNQMRARKDAAHADKLEMENAERRGELVEAEEVKQAWGRIAFTIKNQMLGLPDVLCDELESMIEGLLEAGSKTVDLTEIREVLDRGIRGGLEALKDGD